MRAKAGFVADAKCGMTSLRPAALRQDSAEAVHVPYMQPPGVITAKGLVVISVQQIAGELRPFWGLELGER